MITLMQYSKERQFDDDTGVLSTLRNDCLVMCQSMYVLMGLIPDTSAETTKSNDFSLPKIARGKKGGFLGSAEKSGDNSENLEQGRNKVESLFDPRGEKMQKLKEFEKMFDNSFSAMDSDSNSIKMSNAKFFEVLSTAQEADLSETLSTHFKHTDALQGLELPLFVDGSTVMGVQYKVLDSFKNEVKIAGSLAVFCEKLKKLVHHTLVLQE
jgi:hypothetical protein